MDKLNQIGYTSYAANQFGLFRVGNKVQYLTPHSESLWNHQSPSNENTVPIRTNFTTGTPYQMKDKHLKKTDLVDLGGI